jgi:hypothetical protein
MLKIWYTNFWPQWNEENFISPILQRHFDVILDKHNPDIIFYSIFHNNEDDYSKYKCPKIFFVAENIRGYNPSSQAALNVMLTSANYSITFDPPSETNFRFPLWQVFLFIWPHLKDLLFNKIDNSKSFDRFCSFTVSNPSNFFRNGFFNAMKTHFQVFSYGRYMTNDFGLINLSQGKHWITAKQEFFTKYKHKYCIAFENTSYPGYTTEKLMGAFLAGSLPLYWGDPKVNQDWNPESFINVGKLGSDKTIELIKQIESDKTGELFMKMYKQPVFTDEQKNKLIENLANFEPWLINVVKKLTL